ncbi:DJ-1/PfpI family protein, partial [Enterobacter cloacae]|uniref:DJ-1/PfpI family protein n=1 Tax=Enterobacter cloacae TaxID=550 RepID=UPI0021D35ED3
IITDGDLSLLESADLIVVPGWRGLDSPVPDALCSALRQASARGCQLLSICSGVFVLAASGLLNGRKATTHWRYIETLKTRFSDSDALEVVQYEDEGDVLSCAGSPARIYLW